jgi:hypothetical protein
LHIGCYFNNIEIVKVLLQHPDIDINICNYENDTPLHKACLAARYDIVELLLSKNADGLSMKNQEGLKPKEMTKDPAIKKLLTAIEKTEKFNIQQQFFELVLHNELENVNKLLKSKRCDIDCVDTFGSTALHLAANRNQCEMAILLTQKGINTIIKNKHQLTALDLAKTSEMKEIIGFVPATNWRKYEGFLLKKRKFLGYKEYYVVLNKGSIIYYQSRKDAAQDRNARGKYILNNAFIRDQPNNGQHDFSACSWVINFTNGRKHTLCSAIPNKKKSAKTIEFPAVASTAATAAAVSGATSTELASNTELDSNGSNIIKQKSQLNPLERKKKWIQAFKEHIRYSDSHVQAHNKEAQQKILPLESLQQNLNSLKLSEDKLNFMLTQIEQQLGTISAFDLNQLPHQSNLYQILLNHKTNFDNLKTQITSFIGDTNKCIQLHEQRHSLLKSQASESRLKCELLEQSLRVLAQENLDLEVKKSRRRGRELQKFKNI